MADNKFLDPAGTYAGGYTSDIKNPNTARGSNQRGIIQVVVTAGSVEFQGKVQADAPWVTVKTYNVNTIEEAVLMPLMRVVVADSAVVYITEAK